MIQLAPIDLALIFAYFLALLLLGMWRSRRDATPDDFLIAGRRLTVPAFVASLVSTWYGGILGVGEFSYRYGLSNWLIFGVPYYLYAAIFALFLAARARRTRHITIPDQLEKAYDRRTSIAGAGFIFLLSLPAPYLLMLGILLQLLWPIPLWLAVSFAGTFSLLYIFRAGLMAVVRTDMLQFLMMFIGFGVLVALAVVKLGGMDFLQQRLPDSHWKWHGGHSVQYILVWYVIAMATLVDPNFYQRCYAAQDERVAKQGIFISIGFWFLFDALTTTAGLYARAALPDLGNPVESYPRLAMLLLPDVARGLFFIALLATIMSTLDSFFFVSAVTLGRDVLAKWLKGRAASDHTRKWTRIGMGLTLVISVGLAIGNPSVIEIWYQLGSVATPALLLPLLASHIPGWAPRKQAAFASVLFAGAVSFLWLVVSLKAGANLMGIEPIFPGLLVSIMIWIVDRVSRRKSRR